MNIRERIKTYFAGVGWNRIMFTILGNVFAGMGIGIFKLSGLGNDPFSGMNMALSADLHMSYPLFQVLINIIFFIVQFIFGRHYIGIGTIVNAVFLGYFCSFFYWLFSMMFVPHTLVLQLITLAAGIVICSFGLSMYQTADAGVAPYDSFAIILDEKLPKIPYFWCRIFCDGCCALVCFLAGGIIGIGTLATTFGFGPVIHFFNKHFSEKVIRKAAEN